MKKLLVSALALAAVVAATLASATGIPATPAVITFGVAMVESVTNPEPVPAHLTDACKPQTVQAKGANYVYTTYEHCIAQAPAK